MKTRWSCCWRRCEWDTTKVTAVLCYILLLLTEQSYESNIPSQSASSYTFYFALFLEKNLECSLNHIIILLFASGKVSHILFCWRANIELLFWAKKNTYPMKLQFVGLGTFKKGRKKQRVKLFTIYLDLFASGLVSLDIACVRLSATASSSKVDTQNIINFPL